MKIDLLHNKIVAETMTEEFKESVDSTLIPLLLNIYSEDEILGIQMYEDYISDKFSYRGYWYYPLTVITTSGYDTVWIKWALNEEDFEGGLPYSYVGDGKIDFAFAKEIPDGFADALKGRALYCEDGLIKVGVKSSAEPSRLSGKYSQTFLDELARQITPAIENATSTSGIAGSSIELVFTFAAGTYMDHISDNVTYRRLTMIDGASAPRDFWVKWTRLDGAVACSVADNVWGDNISFEIGEDVSSKMLEKEFRYLLGAVGAKYHSAMSRSGVTAWRDLIKRAVKYGEIEKIEKEVELLPETLALKEQLAAALGMSEAQVAAQTNEISIEADSDGDDEFARAMQKAREIALGEEAFEEIPEPDLEEIIDDEPADEEIVDEPAIEEIFEESVAAEDNEIFEESEEESDELFADEISEETVENEDSDEDELLPEVEEIEETEDAYESEAESEELLIMEEADETSVEDGPAGEFEMASTEEEVGEILDSLFGNIVYEDEPEEEEPAIDELDELTKMALDALAFAKDIEDEPAEETLGEMTFEIEEPAFPDEPAEADAAEEIPENAEETAEPVIEEIAESSTEEVAEPVAVYDDAPYIDEERIRNEIEAKIRLEYESRARIRAEEEVAKLRREQEKLRVENEALLAEAQKEKEAIRLEYERLKEQTERNEAAVKARDAVRRAEEEKLRSEIEARLRHEARERERLAEAARMAIEEQRRLEAEAARAQRIVEEEERARRFAEERAAEEARLEEMRRSELERVRREEEARQKALRETMPEMGNGEYNYTNRNVRLVFRRSVDPNITVRIQQIMKAAVEYYGKEKMYIKVRASVPDNQTVLLEFIHIPLEEMDLLGNIIKILGNSGLGIARAIIE